MRWAGSVLWAVLLLGAPAARDQAEPPSKGEPSYQDTFAGPIVDLSATKITVARTLLGGKTEKRTFLIKADTRIEGKLRVHAKVTVGFIKSDEGNVARLIVVRHENGKR